VVLVYAMFCTIANGMDACLASRYFRNRILDGNFRGYFAAVSLVLFLGYWVFFESCCLSYLADDR